MSDLLGTKKVWCAGLSQQLFIHTTLLSALPRIASVQTPLSHWLFSPPQPLCFSFAQLSTQLKLIECNFSLCFSHAYLISASHICTRLLLWGIARGLTLGLDQWGNVHVQNVCIFHCTVCLDVRFHRWC